MADDKEPPNRSGYQVGYYKPPQHTRFKKGQSGNPKGRSKIERAVHDVRLIIEEVLERPVTVTEGGKKQTISKLQAILEAERRNALNGNLTAVRSLIKRAEKCGLMSKARPTSGITLTEPDGEMGRIVRMFRFEACPQPGKPDRRHQAVRVWGQT